LDYHNDLAVLGLGAVEGEPFRVRTSAKPDCPLARDAINWLVELGTRSVDKTGVSSKNMVSGLFYLFDSFNRLYQLSELHQVFLAEQIRIISEHSHEFPVVVQHGDPGTWNMLATKQDRVIVIDWEAGEQQGMPLWDLFYFLRTFAAWIARQRGSQDSLNNFVESFLKPSPLRVLLHDSIERYCSQVGVAAELVRPLFYTCWMHRALKEATRLTRDQLEGGHYVNLLRLTIEQRTW
jgi:thiamine kinase-like enzyme